MVRFFKRIPRSKVKAGEAIPPAPGRAARTSPRRRIVPPGFCLFPAILLLGWVVAAPAAGESGGMCGGQPPVVESEVVSSIQVLKELMAMWPRISPADEETIVRGYGLTSARMNCILGKLMAGNDIFNWGSPEAYGVTLTPEEMDLLRQHQNDSLILKKHLEQNLNIRGEQ